MGEDFPLDANQVQQPQEGETTHIDVASHDGDSQLGGVALAVQSDPNRPRTAEELKQDFDGEMAKPDSEQAVQGIDNEISDVARRRESNEQSIAFTKGYKPRHPGRAPHPEAGGMDHEDYDAEAWEYSHYDSGAELDGLYDRDDQLSGQIDELEALREKVESGDATLTEKFSLAEKSRLAGEYNRKRHNADMLAFNYDTRRGAEIIGSQELSTSLETLLSSVEGDGQPANSQWHHEHWATDENDKVVLRYSRDTFTTEQDGKKITLEVGAKAVPSNGAYYAPPDPDNLPKGYDADRLARTVSLTVDTPDYKHEGGWVHQGQKHAEYYGFRLFDDGRVAQQAKWNNGHGSKSQIPNIIIGIEDIDKIQGYVDSINAGDQHEEQ